MEHKNLNVPDFHKNWEEYFNSIKTTLEKNLKDKVELTINIVNSPLKDSIELKKDPNYIPTNLIEIDETNISTKYINNEFIEYILNNLSEDIEVLNVPGEFISRIGLLSMFPKLREIKITNYYELTQDDILNIKNNTTINRVESLNFKEAFNDFNENAIYYDGKIMEIKFLDKELNIINSIPRLTSIANNFFINDLYKNINDVIQYIQENNININELEYFNIISSKENEDYISYNSKDNEMEYCGLIKELRPLIEKLNSIGIIPSKIYLKLENKDYDFSSLRGSKLPIEIDYDVLNTATIEEFIAMRETINYFKELITQNNLSPIEQVTYAYDIIKSFEYKEATEKGDSRSPHEYVVSGKIVCVGYSLFLEQVLKELGFKIKYLPVNVLEENNKYSRYESNHGRNIIRIDDDKYNIHMVAALDATWDSNTVTNTQYRFSNEESSKGKLIDINDLLSYIYFLIPKCEYNYVFDDKELPALFNYPIQMFAKNFDMIPKIERPLNSFDNGLSFLQELFDKEEKNEMERYIEAKRPSYDIFKQIIRNVKIAEGYGYKETENFINNINLEDPNTIKTR